MTKAHDERGKRLVTDADLDRIEATATPMYQSTRDAAGASKYLVSDLCQWIVRLVAEVRRLRCTEGPSVECTQCHRADGMHKLGCGERFGAEPDGERRDLTPCGNLVCTGCRVCGCPALGIAPQAAPTDDDREALLTEADALVASWDQKGSWSSDSPVGMVMRLAAALRRSEVPEPSTYGEDDWDNRDDEVNGETRGFLSCGRCDWSTTRGLFADLREHERTHESPQGEPSDAQVEAAAQALFEPDGPGGDYTWAEMVVEDPSRADIWREDARKVLRAAGGAR